MILLHFFEMKFIIIVGTMRRAAIFTEIQNIYTESDQVIFVVVVVLVVVGKNRLHACECVGKRHR